MSPSGGGPVSQLARDDTVQFGSPRPRRRPWLRWLPLVVPLAVAAIVVTAAGHPAKPPAETVTQVGHRLLGVRAGWELVGRGAREVVRIELARGRIIATAVPAVRSDGPVSFIARSAQVIIRPLDSVPGYSVPDGKAAHRLPGLLSSGGYAIPGPRSGQVWLQGGRIDSPIWLVGQNGSTIRSHIADPAGGPWLPASDGSGYLLLYDISGQGVYEARPGVLRRITAGTVAAVGPTRWLAVQCQGRDRCSMTVVDSATGARHVISRSPAVSGYLPGGVISPDGSIAAVSWATGGRQPALRLIDLASGSEYPVDLPGGQALLAPATAVWSPDGRWLFVAADGRLLAVDAWTRRPRSLGVALPKITQVAIEKGPA